MADSVIGSKEIAIAIIAYVLGEIVKQTGIASPLAPDQIYATGLALMAIARVFWTEGKITSFMPK